MNVKSLAQYIQIKLQQDIVKDAEDEAVSKTADAIVAARADAKANGQDEDAAAAKVKAVKLRNIDDEVPTLEWCGRLALKHSGDARNKVGKMKGLKEDILDRVRADPDDVGKRKPKKAKGGGRPG